MDTQRVAVVGRLGVIVLIAYASAYYLPAVIASEIAAELRIERSIVFLGLSLALLVSAFLAPVVGRQVDERGGRAVLLAGCVLYCVGLLVLASAGSREGVLLAWLILGVAMAAGSIDVAYASLVRLYGPSARTLITAITLVGGFSSTVGWLASAYMLTAIGWRGACLAWALLNIVIAVPLALATPRGNAPPAINAESSQLPTEPSNRLTTWLLAYVFAVTWFIGTSMAAHLPGLLQAAGMGAGASVAIAALLGPAQVAGRLFEFTAMKRVDPVNSARAASLAHPVGGIVLMILGGPAGVVFALFHGVGNGVMTVANGTLPLHIFGPAGYGARQGALMVLARFAQAISPFLFGLALASFGTAALWISVGLGVTSFLALWILGAQRHEASRA